MHRLQFFCCLWVSNEGEETRARNVLRAPKRKFGERLTIAAILRYLRPGNWKQTAERLGTRGSVKVLAEVCAMQVMVGQLSIPIKVIFV